MPQRPGRFLGGEFRRGGGGRFLGISTGAAVISCPSIWPREYLRLKTYSWQQPKKTLLYLRPYASLHFLLRRQY